MNLNPPELFEPDSLKQDEFDLLRECVREKLGIALSDAKKPVLEARLQKRLRMTGIRTFSNYCHYLFSQEGEGERSQFIDAVTTHKTFFFREPEHLNFVCDTVLAEMFSGSSPSRERMLEIWSAGCSSGEEPYSIAIQLERFKAANPTRNLTYSILATDVSMAAVCTARKAVYAEESLVDLPREVIVKYFLKSKDASKKEKKIVPEIRQHVRFGVLNLNDHFRFDKKLDLIFCRNVMIYFDESTKEKVVRQLVDCLKPGGYLFIGFSESLRNIDRRLAQAGPSTYRRNLHAN